jgi:1,4-alpha-glucan branching enzyme
MGWMHDTLEYMRSDPLFRRNIHHKLTFSLQYAFSENFLLPFSHDEVVHGKGSLINKMPGDDWQRFANLRALYGYMFGHPGKKLLFMGSEFGQWKEWNFDRELDWMLLDQDPHRRLRDYLRALNGLYAAEPSLHELDFEPAGFKWIDFRDVDKSVVSFLRLARNAEDHLVVVANFTPVPRYGYWIGVPGAGPYRELLNSDAREFGGSQVGNPETIPVVAGEWHGQPGYVSLTLPPLGVLFLKPMPPERPKPRPGRKKKA